MKFGVCVGKDIEKMKYIKSVGYDYAEGHCQEIARKDKAYLEHKKKYVKSRSRNGSSHGSDDRLWK